MKVAIVDLSDNSIKLTYPAPADQSKYGGPWGDPESHEHVEYDDSATGDCIQASGSPGSIVISKDDQAERNQKLAEMRSQRDSKMKDADHLVNDLAVGDRSDAAAISAYRQALKDITNPYKDADPSQGTAALDALADDLSDLSWPEKP